MIKHPVAYRKVAAEKIIFLRKKFEDRIENFWLMLIASILDSCTC